MQRRRDKIAASKKKGLWVGGVVPLGYKVVDRKLEIDEAEAPIVRLIFERYCALASLIALMRELREREVVTRLLTASIRRSLTRVSSIKCRKSWPATRRPRAIPNPDRRPCSLEGSTTTAAIA